MHCTLGLGTNPHHKMSTIKHCTLDLGTAYHMRWFPINMHCKLGLGIAYWAPSATIRCPPSSMNVQRTNSHYETLLGELDRGLLPRLGLIHVHIYFDNACTAHYVDLGTNRHYETLVDLGSACYLTRRAEHWLNTENNNAVLSVGPRV